MSELVYREVLPEDYERFAQIQAVSYNDDPARALERVRAEGSRWRRGVYQDGRLVCGAYVYPLQISASGAAVSGGGIGNVATPPEDRRRGFTEFLLRGISAELLETGAPFCTLGAFKESFYRRYGWATFHETRVFSGSPQQFASFRHRQRGTWLPVGAEAIGEFDAIYRGALRARFGPVLRDEAWWRGGVLQRFNYLWRDEAGQARAYMLFGFEGDWPRTLGCREVIALDPEARTQVFAFFASHEDQSGTIRFSAPSDAPVQMLLDDPLECKMEPGYMLRLLDVAQALEALPYRGDARGSLTLRVADDWMTHNQGVFELEVAEGRGVCRRLPDASDAALALDVRQLAQIVSRHLRPRTAAAFGLLEVNERPALALLDTLFSGPAPFVSDWF
jgi:predicted acetyltransferase